MGSSPSKSKITNLILESLKNSINPDIAISKMEPRYPLDYENDIYNQQEITVDNEENNDDFENSILNNNNEINDNKNYPQNCIGQISFFKNETEYKITGSIIGENIILTLASSIYDFETKNFVSNITFKDSNNIIYKNPEIKIYKNYITSNQKKDDLAILYFKEQISKFFLGIDLEEISNLPNIDINIYGLDLNGNLFHGITNAENQEDNLINYNILLKKGEEGSPLIKILDNKYYIIGLHIFTEENNENKNYGNIFNEEIIQFIYDIKEKERIFIDESKVINLDLSGQNLSPFDMEFIKDFNFEKLQILNLSNNSIKIQGVYYLKQARLENLKILILDLNEIGDEGIGYLLQANFRNLTHLSLFCNNISYKGIKELIKFDCKKSLKKLDLSENPKIGDEGIAKLISVNWDNLDTLFINKIKLTIKGLEKFKNCNIKKIFMKDNQINVEEAKKIILAFKLSKREIITGIPELDEL